MPSATTYVVRLVYFTLSIESNIEVQYLEQGKNPDEQRKTQTDLSKHFQYTKHPTD